MSYVHVMDNLTVIFPILAASSVIILIIIKVYIKIREYLPISVNCWFCNNNTKVAYNKFNSWICPKCDQYNGFLQDGGYNKIITAQHDEYLNIPSASSPRLRYNRQSPTLCQNCNINQQLKVAQLASFVPLDSNSFDNEVDSYSQQLEKVYGVCSNCEKRIASLLEKEKIKFSQCYKEKSTTELNSAVLEKPVKRVGNKLIYYGVVLGCVPQLFDVIFRYDSVKTLCLSLYRDYMVKLNVPNFLKDLIDYKHVGIWIVDEYSRNHQSLNYGCIGVCVLVYFIGSVRSRTILNVLNLTAWCIMFSLKYFSVHDSKSIDLLQGVTAAVFLVLNKRNNVVIDGSINKKRRISKSDGGKNATVRNGQCFPKRESLRNNVLQSTNSAFTTVYKSREPPKDTGFQNLTEEWNLSSKPINPSPYQKNYGDDLGISSLHLGMRKRKGVKNHLTTEPRPHYNRSNDTIWNRSPILSPPRLNVGTDRCAASSNSVSEQHLSQTRCSSQTSGISSLSSTPQPHDTSINDRDFDCFSDTPINSPNQVMGFYPSYDPMYQQQLAVSPYAYYQFAAMFHRMHTPSSSFSSESSGDRTLVNNMHKCKHDMFYIILISLIIICNFILIGLISYKEFFTSKV